MQWRAILNLWGWFACLIGLLIGFSAVVSQMYHDVDVKELWLASFSSIIAGWILLLFFRKRRLEEMSHRDATLLVVLSWLSASLLGAFPYFITEVAGPFSIPSFINALFESVAGFTTTGASIFGSTLPLGNLSHGLLFWRALTHWIGGVGIVFISLILLPFIQTGGMELYQAGALSREKLRFRFIETAKALLIIYVTITACEIVLLRLGGMNLFDSICHSFATVSSGGFSTRSNSIEYYHSLYIETIIIIFMILGTTSFALHYQMARGQLKAYWKNAEWKFYIGTLIIGILLVTIDLKLHHSSHGFREAIFNTVSINTTTGFSSADFNTWPPFSRTILFTLMFMGAMGGSTCGGIKSFRILLLFKYIHRQLMRLIHPAGFTPVKLEGRVVNREVLDGITAFFFLYITIFIAAVLFLTFFGINWQSAISGAAATLGGVGPGFEMFGPYGNYYGVSDPAKLVFIVCMLLGRIEIFPLLLVLSSSFWKK